MRLISNVLLGATCLWFGYYLGSRATTAPSLLAKAPQEVSNSNITSIGDESGDDEIYDGDLAAVEGIGPCKLVLVVRTDLNMTPGKISAQCGHATLACYKSLMKKNPRLVRHWERTGQAKIALRVDSEEHIMELEAIAKSLNLCARSIHDAGRTQVAAGSRTVLGIGPGPVDLVNEVTGKLRLL